MKYPGSPAPTVTVNVCCEESDPSLTVSVIVEKPISPGTGTSCTVRVVPVPVPAGSQVLALSVQSATSFRPSDVDKGSTDTRELGCQVRIEVGDGGA